VVKPAAEEIPTTRPVFLHLKHNQFKLNAFKVANSRNATLDGKL